MSSDSETDNDTHGMFGSTQEDVTDIATLLSAEQNIFRAQTCLPQRILHEVLVRNKNDLHQVEDIIRSFLKGDFGNCAPLQSSTYSAFRIKMLLHLRNRTWEQSTELHDLPQNICFVPITNTLCLRADMTSLSVVIIERPQQQQ
eukprot:95130-Rhodomonas_salina.5